MIEKVAINIANNFKTNVLEGRHSTVQIKPFTDQTGALLIVSLTSLQGSRIILNNL